MMFIDTNWGTDIIVNFLDVGRTLISKVVSIGKTLYQYISCPHFSCFIVKEFQSYSQIHFNADLHLFLPPIGNICSWVFKKCRC